MKKRMSAVVVIVIGSLSGPLFAEQIAYITDSLRLRLYTNPSTASKIIHTLESGDSVVVLNSQGAFSQVRTDADSTGWVKSAFLVEEPPAKLLYYTVSEQNKQLEQQIKELQNNAANKNDVETNQIIQLEQALVEQQQTNHLLQEEISSLKQKSQRQDSFDSNIDSNHSNATINLARSFSKHILIAASIIAGLLLFGFLVGIKFSSWRMQKRLHGFRLG